MKPTNETKQALLQHPLPPSSTSRPAPAPAPTEPARGVNLGGLLGVAALGLLIVTIARREPTADERREGELLRMLSDGTITPWGIAELVRLSWQLAYTGRDWWSLSTDERRDFELRMKASWGILTDAEDNERFPLMWKLVEQRWAAEKEAS